MAPKFTAKQGQYLAYIHYYAIMFRWAPAEADLVAFFRSSGPTVHQMIVRLTDNGLIHRTPGQARSIRLLVDSKELPGRVPPEAPAATGGFRPRVGRRPG